MKRRNNDKRKCSLTYIFPVSFIFFFLSLYIRKITLPPDQIGGFTCILSPSSQDILFMFIIFFHIYFMRSYVSRCYVYFMSHNVVYIFFYDIDYLYLINHKMYTNYEQEKRKVFHIYKFKSTKQSIVKYSVCFLPFFSPLMRPYLKK